MGIIAFVGTMALLSAVETESFLDASRSLCRGQFRKRDGINVHGVGVMCSSRGVDSRRESSSFQGKDSHLLGVEHLGLFDPFCDSGGD